MMTNELQEYRLDRTGKAPLTFMGERIARVHGEDYLDERRKNPRWHNIELYRTRSGRYVLHVRYHTEWGEEFGYDEAAVLESPADVAGCLGSWDAIFPVTGYPPGEAFREKQDRLLAEVQTRFERCASVLFDQLGPEFTEYVD